MGLFSHDRAPTVTAASALTRLVAEAVTATSPVIVVCRSGRRSDHAVVSLRKAGVDALNLDDGAPGAVI